MMRIVRAGFSSAVGAAALCLVSLAALPPETLAGGTAAQPAKMSAPAKKPSKASAKTTKAKKVTRAPVSKKASRAKSKPKQRRRAVAKQTVTPGPQTAPDGTPLVQSGSVLVVDATGHQIFAKNPDIKRPIASITKLMTAMVVLDTDLPLSEMITISAEDRDELLNTRSRLADGLATLSRFELLHIALMSSENRAAAALGRTTFTGGTPAFVTAMNRKAQRLGMANTRFFDSTGLDQRNVSTARDLVQLLEAAYEYPLIRFATTTESTEVHPYPERAGMTYLNTNRLVRGGQWDIELSKTGYLKVAGRCLAMRTRIDNQPMYMVFLKAPGKLTPFGDSNRLRQWLESRS